MTGISLRLQYLSPHVSTGAKGAVLPNLGIKMVAQNFSKISSEIMLKFCLSSLSKNHCVFSSQIRMTGRSHHDNPYQQFSVDCAASLSSSPWVRWLILMKSSGATMLLMYNHHPSHTSVPGPLWSCLRCEKFFPELRN